MCVRAALELVEEEVGHVGAAQLKAPTRQGSVLDR
jgi:hypothetical protein